MVSLWFLLTVYAGTNAFIVTILAAKEAGGGVARYAVGVLLGIVLGTVCTAVGEKVSRRLASGSESWLPLVYLAKAVWMFVAPFLSFMLTTSLLHLVLP